MLFGREGEDQVSKTFHGMSSTIMPNLVEMDLIV
jgi:hypothetical protein